MQHATGRLLSYTATCCDASRETQRFDVSIAESGQDRPKGWVPQWLRDRLPAAVGGGPASGESEELTLDSEYDHPVLVSTHCETLVMLAVFVLRG